MYQGDFIPVAPNSDQARQHNQNLPGMGGIYNVINLHVYHYGGNNPIIYLDPDGEANWPMVRRGVTNIAAGIGQISGGIAVYAASGAGTVASGGSATPLAIVGGIAATGLVVNGWVQASVGVAQVIAGFSANDNTLADAHNNIPSTMNQMLAIPVDDIISSISGEPSTIAQDIATVVDAVTNAVVPSPGGTAGKAVQIFLTATEALNNY